MDIVIGVIILTVITVLVIIPGIAYLFGKGQT